VERLHALQVAAGLDAPPPERHIVPEGFRGWAILHFGVEGAPPLRSEHGTLVVEYPASGQLSTSTLADDAEGFLHREYFERGAAGLVPLSRLGRIWGEYNMRIARDEDGTLMSRSSGFFVGTLEEFRAAERPYTDVELPELATPLPTPLP